MAKKTSSDIETISEVGQASSWMKKLAKGVVSIASSKENEKKENIKLPSPSLNWALAGGIQKGKTAMFYGPESAGKTMLAMMTVIADQNIDPNGIWIWFNAEFSFDKDRFTELGGDPDRLLLVNSNNYSDIFDYFYHSISEACKAGAPIRGAVVDSIRSIVYPKDEKIKEDTGNMMIGGAAALYLSSALKIWLSVQATYKITSVFIQQVSVNMNMYSSEKWINSGGKALDHACDYKILVEKAEAKAGKIFSETMKAVGGADMQIGHTIKCTIKKSRLGVPNRVANMKFVYSKGIVDQIEEIYELCKAVGIIKHPEGKGNSYWQILDREAVFGEKKMLEMFKEDIGLQNEAWMSLLNYSGDACKSDEDDEGETDELA